MKVNNRSRVGSLQLTADADGLISRAGTALVGDLAARLGLTAELSEALSHLHSRTPTHHPARVLVDLATPCSTAASASLTSAPSPASPISSGRSPRTRPPRASCWRSAREA